MLSKEMYVILSKISREPTQYDKLLSACNIADEELHTLLCDAWDDDYGYINAGPIVREYDISLTERGAAAVEDYKAQVRNMKLYRWSLTVAVIAAIASIGSAIAAFIMLFA